MRRQNLARNSTNASLADPPTGWVQQFAFLLLAEENDSGFESSNRFLMSLVVLLKVTFANNGKMGYVNLRMPKIYMQL